MISRGRKYRIAIGLIAGWAMAVLVPGVVAGLMVYQVLAGADCFTNRDGDDIAAGVALGHTIAGVAQCNP